MARRCPSLRPARASGSQFRLLRRRQRGDRRGSRCHHPAPEQRHEVTAGWFEAGLGPVRRPDRRLGGAPGPGPFRPRPVDSAGDRYALVGWPSKRGHGERAEDWERRAPDRVFGASGLQRLLSGRALARVGAFDPAFGAYYEDVDLAVPPPLGRLRVRLRPAVQGPARRLGQLRPRPAGPPAPDGAQRRGPVLDESPPAVARRGDRAARRLHARPGRLAPGPGPPKPLRPGQARRPPGLPTSGDDVGLGSTWPGPRSPPRTSR
jgi:hypothetical protein